MKKLLFLLPAFLFLMPALCYSQEAFSLVEEATVKSDILDEERNIRIYFPRDYNDSENRYPVLYLLDGGTHFQHATAAVNYLRMYGKMCDIIIVAIMNVDRTRDFSPVHEPAFPTSGGAAKFLGFLSDELISSMDEDFRTSGYNILYGHSFGGTFAAYALSEKPGLFNAYIAVSPYLQYADNFMVKQAEASYKPMKGEDHVFYMTVGNEPDYVEPLAAFEKIIETKMDGSLDFKYTKMSEEDHGTAAYISLFTGLKYIFSDYQIAQKTMVKGLEATDAHYKMLSKKFGINATTPENILNHLGYHYLQENNMDEAIKVFKVNVKRYPASANVYDSLGEAYENDLQYDKAKENYQKAVELGQKEGNPNTRIFQQNLDRVSSQ